MKTKKEKRQPMTVRFLPKNKKIALKNKVKGDSISDYVNKLVERDENNN